MVDYNGVWVLLNKKKRERVVFKKSACKRRRHSHNHIKKIFLRAVFAYYFFVCWNEMHWGFECLSIRFFVFCDVWPSFRFSFALIFFIFFLLLVEIFYCWYTFFLWCTTLVFVASQKIFFFSVRKFGIFSFCRRYLLFYPIKLVYSKGPKGLDWVFFLLWD